MGSEEEAFKNPAMIGYLVKRMHERDSNEQIGKTKIQKMFYLLSREGIGSYAYSLYHYGPYSPEVANDLDYAYNLDLIKIRWENERGFFIDATEKEEGYEHLIEEGTKAKIDGLVRKFAGFKATDLSIIATGLYLKDNYDMNDSDIPHAVQELKPKFALNYVQEVWKTAIERNRAAPNTGMANR